MKSSLCRRLVLPAAVLLLTLTCPGCAEKNFSSLLPGIQQRGQYIQRVPFYEQNEAACGPAALAAVMAFWGTPRSIEEIRSKVFLPQLKGSLPMDMESYAREAGFETRSFAGDLDQLKTAIRKGTPAICLLDLGFSLYRRPHYIVAIGFDDEEAVVVEHDGLKPNRVVGYAAFLKSWSRAGRWMLLITPRSGGAAL